MKLITVVTTDDNGAKALAAIRAILKLSSVPATITVKTVTYEEWARDKRGIVRRKTPLKGERT